MLSHNDERSLQHKIPAAENALPPLRTSLGRSSSSRGLAAGNDHDVECPVANSAISVLMAACSCLSASDGGEMTGENGHCDACIDSSSR